MSIIYNIRNILQNSLKYQNRILAAVAAAIGLVYAWLGAGMSFIGDDIGYYSGMSASIRHLWEYPLWVGRHILSTNGRMANLISPIFYHLLPQWIF